MEEYRLGICDSDTGYMLGLMDYMNMSPNIPFHVSVFTSLKDMDREVADGRIDILLVDSSMEKYMGKCGGNCGEIFVDSCVEASVGNSVETYIDVLAEAEKKDLPVVRLTETVESTDDQKYICKYQSMEDISATLSRIAKHSIKRSLIGSGGFYGVYSPFGRCGVSAYALKLASESEDSLLVRLENFRELNSGGDDSFMYYLLSHNESIGDVIRAMKETGEHKIKTIEGPLSYQDIRELKQADIEWFKAYVDKDNCCGTVVFDIGSGALGSFDALLAFDAVYVLCVPGADGKLTSFKKIIGYGNGSGFEKILKFVDMEE